MTSQPSLGSLLSPLNTCSASQDVQRTVLQEELCYNTTEHFDIFPVTVLGCCHKHCN